MIGQQVTIVMSAFGAHAESSNIVKGTLVSRDDVGVMLERPGSDLGHYRNTFIPWYGIRYIEFERVGAARQ